MNHQELVRRVVARVLGPSVSSVRVMSSPDLVQRVVARYKAANVAMEHPSDEALKKYLHEHPNADPSNHTVKKTEHGSAGAPAGDANTERLRANVKHLTKNTQELHAIVHKSEGAMGRLTKQFENQVNSRRGDPKKAAELAQKIQFAHQDALTATEVNLTHSQSIYNMAEKAGYAKADLSRLKGQIDEAKKVVEDIKKGDYASKKLTGTHSDLFAVGVLHENTTNLMSAATGMQAAIEHIAKG